MRGLRAVRREKEGLVVVVEVGWKGDGKGGEEGREFQYEQVRGDGARSGDVREDMGR